jgi:hypothetical protein
VGLANDIEHRPSQQYRGAGDDLTLLRGRNTMLFLNPVIFASAGYYLMAVADLMDGAVALTAPASIAERRRSQFKVIEGGKLI